MIKGIKKNETNPSFFFVFFLMTLQGGSANASSTPGTSTLGEVQALLSSLDGRAIMSRATGWNKKFDSIQIPAKNALALGDEAAREMAELHRSGGNLRTLVSLLEAYQRSKATPAHGLGSGGAASAHGPRRDPGASQAEVADLKARLADATRRLGEASKFQPPKVKDDDDGVDDLVAFVQGLLPELDDSARTEFQTGILPILGTLPTPSMKNLILKGFITKVSGSASALSSAERDELMAEIARLKAALLAQEGFEVKRNEFGMIPASLPISYDFIHDDNLVDFSSDSDRYLGQLRGLGEALVVIRDYFEEDTDRIKPLLGVPSVIYGSEIKGRIDKIAAYRETPHAAFEDINTIYSLIQNLAKRLSAPALDKLRRIGTLQPSIEGYSRTLRDFLDNKSDFKLAAAGIVYAKTQRDLRGGLQRIESERLLSYKGEQMTYGELEAQFRKFTQGIISFLEMVHRINAEELAADATALESANAPIEGAISKMQALSEYGTAKEISDLFKGTSSMAAPLQLQLGRAVSATPRTKRQKLTREEITRFNFPDNLVEKGFMYVFNDIIDSELLAYTTAFDSLDAELKKSLDLYIFHKYKESLVQIARSIDLAHINPRSVYKTGIEDLVERTKSGDIFAQYLVDAISFERDNKMLLSLNDPSELSDDPEQGARMISFLKILNNIFTLYKGFMAGDSNQRFDGMHTSHPSFVKFEGVPSPAADSSGGGVGAPAPGSAPPPPPPPPPPGGAPPPPPPPGGGGGGGGGFGE